MKEGRKGGRKEGRIPSCGEKKKNERTTRAGCNERHTHTAKEGRTGRKERKEGKEGREEGTKHQLIITVNHKQHPNKEQRRKLNEEGRRSGIQQ